MALNVDLANEGGLSVTGDGGEQAGGVMQLKTAGAIPALGLSRTAAGSQTIGILTLGGTSMASGALIEFKGGFISTTSTVLTTVANTDYALVVQVGLETRYIPLFKAAAIIGAAAF